MEREARVSHQLSGQYVTINPVTDTTQPTRRLSVGDHFKLVIAVRDALDAIPSVQDSYLLRRQFGIADYDGGGFDSPSIGELLQDSDEANLIALGEYLNVEIPGDSALRSAREIDPYNELVAAETALREVVRIGIGDQWINDFPEDKIAGLEAKRAEEDKRRVGITVSQDLLDYTEAYHLESLITKHWEQVQPILGEKRRTETHLKTMLSVRNAIAHARHVFPFERHLLAGVAGQIQNLLAVYRSSSSGPDAFYASINYVRDSFGDQLTRGTESRQSTIPRLAVGQVVTFECSATDPHDRGISWSFHLFGSSSGVLPQTIGAARGSTTVFEWVVTEDHVGEGRSVSIYMSNDSKYKRSNGTDDAVSFRYDVSPPVPTRRR